MKPVMPQQRALDEALCYVWANAKRLHCNRVKCKVPCGTGCLLVARRLAKLGLLESVMEWEAIKRAEPRRKKPTKDELDNLRQIKGELKKTAQEFFEMGGDNHRIAIDLQGVYSKVTEMIRERSHWDRRFMPGRRHP